MRKLIIVLSIFFGACVVQMDAKDGRSGDKPQQEIPIKRKKYKDNDANRSPAFRPIMAFYQDQNIVLAFSNNIGTVALLVTNETTGESWNVLLDSSKEEGSLDISGVPGTYTVSIMLTDGSEYEGTFIL